MYILYITHRILYPTSLVPLIVRNEHYIYYFYVLYVRLHIYEIINTY